MSTSPSQPPPPPPISEPRILRRSSRNKPMPALPLPASPTHAIPKLKKPSVKMAKFASKSNPMPATTTDCDKRPTKSKPPSKPPSQSTSKPASKPASKRPRESLGSTSTSAPSKSASKGKGKSKATPNEGVGEAVRDAPQEKKNAKTAPKRARKEEIGGAMEGGDEDLPSPKKKAKVSPSATADGVWKVVRPLQVTSKGLPRPPTPAPPRIWAGARAELNAILPPLAKHVNGVSWGALEVPLVFFAGEKERDRAFGLAETDAWTGRQIVFSTSRETTVQSPPAVHPPLSSARPESTLPSLPQATYTSSSDPGPSAALPHHPLHIASIEPRACHKCSKADQDPDCEICNSSFSTYTRPIADDDENMEDNGLVCGSEMLAVEGAPMDVQGVEANVDAAAGTDKGKDAAHDAPVSAGQEEHPSTSTISAPAHLPETPPELLALLDVHRSKKPVSLVVASSSPMFPWKMADEVGYVWAGLFSIIDVKEETSSSASPLLSTSKKIGEVPPTVTVRRTWTFTLSWTAGGEEYLRDGPSAWFDSLKYPWWEVSPPNPPPTSTTPAPNTRPSYNTLSDDSDSDMDPAEITDAADADNYCTVGSILPVGLLTPFGSMCSTEDAFPHGFYCPACGRLNVQRFLRHRACESTRCRPAGGPSTVPASGWSFPVGLIRDARHMEPSIFPDFSHVEDVRVQSAEKGELQLYRYMLPPPPLKTEDDSTAPSNRVDGPVIQHLFTGNNRRYQEVPDMLFEQLQLDVRLERKLGEAVFSDAVESFDGEANSNGPAAACYEGIRSFAVEMVQGNILGYERCKLGKLSIRVWVTEGKSRDMFRAESRTLVVVLLGADLDITYNPKDPNAVKTKAVKGGVLRFTMVHGDMLVVTGGDLELSLAREGMCMLLMMECSSPSQTPIEVA